MAQSDKSSDFTGNITLSTEGGSNVTACHVSINNASYNGIKAGTGKLVGAVKISVPEGTKYLHLHVAGWNGETTSLVVSPDGYSGNISLTSDTGISGNSPFTLNGTSNLSDYYKVITFSTALAAKTDLTFTASGGKRFVIWGVSSEEEGGGSVTPVANIGLNQNIVNVTEAEGDGSIAVTYNNINNVDAEVIFYESDGTTQTNEPSWIIADINASNNLEYTYDSNTGAARSAYMKVHEKNEDVYSALITITQAAKTVASPTFSLETGSYMQGTGVVLTATDNTIYYTHTTNGDTPAEPTVNSTLYTEPILLSAGTNKIKAIAVDTYGNISKATTRTYTGIAQTSLPFTWTGTSSAGKEDLNNKVGVSYSLGDNYAPSNAPYRLKFDGTGKHVTIYLDQKPATVSFTAKLFNAAKTGSIMKVQASNDGIVFTDVEEFTIKGNANQTFVFTTSNSFEETHRVVRITMSSKDQNVGVGSINIIGELEPITISAAGWATYCSNHPLDFTGITALTAYTASKDGNVVKFNKVMGKVPANTGLLVSGETTNVPVCASADPVTNILEGVTTETEKPAGTIFVLKKGANGLGFYKNANDFTVRANSAFIPATSIPSGAGARGFISLDDEATGIKGSLTPALSEGESLTPALSEGEGAIYTLDGRKVAVPAKKGVYLFNGKKVVVK